MIVGYTTGVFDMFHVGHLRIIQNAARNCDSLIVGVTTDELAAVRKGKRPIIPFEERLEIVESLDCVAQAVPQDSMDKLEAWTRWHFDRMFVGDDWKGTPAWDLIEAEFAPHGVEIVYFPYTEHTSSTILRSALESIHGADA
ncbi:MAG: tagD [Microbacteriaceae bacterium]|jgi:glycerol-3-phosphate cytidylyltransferase|nr:tagD [Microbacteriaceae bacterium]